MNKNIMIRPRLDNNLQDSDFDDSVISAIVSVFKSDNEIEVACTKSNSFLSWDSNFQFFSECFCFYVPSQDGLSCVQIFIITRITQFNPILLHLCHLVSMMFSYLTSKNKLKTCLIFPLSSQTLCKKWLMYIVDIFCSVDFLACKLEEVF